MIKMMKKRGTLNFNLEQIVKTILLVIVIFSVFLPLGNLAYDFFFPEEHRLAKEDARLIADELESLKQDIDNDEVESAQINPSISFDNPMDIFAYNQDFESLPGSCRKKACICLHLHEEEADICEPLDDIIFKTISLGKIAEIKRKGYASLNLKLERSGSNYLASISRIGKNDG